MLLLALNVAATVACFATLAGSPDQVAMLEKCTAFIQVVTVISLVTSFVLMGLSLFGAYFVYSCRLRRSLDDDLETLAVRNNSMSLHELPPYSLYK